MASGYFGYTYPKQQYHPATGGQTVYLGGAQSPQIAQPPPVPSDMQSGYKDVQQGYQNVQGQYQNLNDLSQQYNQLLGQQPLPGDTSAYNSAYLYNQYAPQMQAGYQQLIAQGNQYAQNLTNLQNQLTGLYDPTLGQAQLQQMQTHGDPASAQHAEMMRQLMTPPRRRDQTIYMYGYT